jgi:hypothetical protein
MWKPLVVGLAVASLLSVPSLGQEPVELERALVRQAPELIKKFKEKGYKNVGVLKFMAAKEGSKPTDNIGTINMLLAQRLEMALILANKPRDPVGIIENASAVAQTIAEASHLKKEKRARLFEARYPLAWGRQKVEPDAFVTGLVQISDDLKLLTVSLMAFDRTENMLTQIVPEFRARNRPEHLAELGESFVMRGFADDGKIEVKPDAAQEKARQEAALAVATKVKEATVTHPAQDAAAPIKLEVRYDGRPVTIEVQDGIARVPEPTEGQRVELLLHRRNKADGRLKAVVKVNGENTIEKQRLPDSACWGWVLETERQTPVSIQGYLIGEDTVEEFRVLSRTESKAREINYGPEVGSITITVFGERTGRPPRTELDDESAEVFAVSKTLKPEQKPDNFAALKATLLDDANRGLIAEGARQKIGKVQTVKFNLDPVPRMALTVVYYKLGTP